jgi:predicted transcriptional regulator
MKEKTEMVFGDREIEIAETLKSCGIGRKVAYLITYLSQVKEATSIEAERATGLRQPEISVGVSEAGQWIKTVEIRDQPGRPRNLYSLAVPFEDIIKQIEEKLLKKTNTMTGKLRRLEKLKA